MDIHVRIAASTDVPAITYIYNQAIALGNATADLSPVATASRQEWLADHSPDKHPVFVAENSAGVIGYCSISPYRPGRMALRHTKEISYYVHEDFRGQGVASSMLNQAIDQCPALKIKTLFAILLDNNPHSVALLEKFGFEHWGYMPDVADFDGDEVGHLYYGLRVPG
jgi:phosphinothricin acetyltransferase